MNSTPEPINSGAEPQASAPPDPTSSSPNQPERRSRSKIAQLPKVLRDRVNTMLDDGLPYKLIIEKLEHSTAPPLPYPISEMTLSRWKDGGHQRHLAEQERQA